MAGKGGLLDKLLFPFRVVWIVLQTIVDLASNLEIVSVALKNLEHQALRRNLTLLGIVIGIAAIVTLSSLGESLNSSIEKQFQTLGMNNVFVEPGGDFASTAFSRVPEKDIRIVEKVPHVELVVPFFETSVVALNGNEETSLFLIGIEPKHQEYLQEIGYIDLKEGRFLSDNDVYSLVLYENFLKTAFSSELSLRETLEINGKKFKIVGVSKQSDMGFSSFGMINMALTSKKALQDFLGEKDPTELAVKVSSRDLVPEAVRRIEQRLERSHGEKNFTVFSSEGLLQTTSQVIGMVQVFVLAITAIALLVGGIGIMNTMFMAVTERTREIGTMRAIGASEKLIRSIFLAEAGIVGTVGGLIGTIIGFLLAFAMAQVATGSGFALAFELNPALALGAILFSFLLGIISGIAPAEKAITLDPVEAIRYE